MAHMINSKAIMAYGIEKLKTLAVWFLKGQVGVLQVL